MIPPSLLKQLRGRYSRAWRTPSSRAELNTMPVPYPFSEIADAPYNRGLDKRQKKQVVFFNTLKPIVIVMDYKGRICRLIVDELPVDAYGVRVLSTARELWAKQGKVCVSTGRALGDSFTVVQIIGGEPMNYPQRVIDVITELRSANANVRVKLFTGFPDVEGLLKVAPLCDAIAVTLTSPEDEHHFVLRG